MTHSLSRAGFVAVFGTPSQLTLWIVHLACYVMDVVHGGHHLITAGTIEEFKDHWSRRPGMGIVFHADTPNSEIVNLFKSVPGRFIVVHERIERVVSDACSFRNLDEITALRFATRSICTLSELAARDGAWVINEDSMDLSGFEFLDRYLQFLCLDLSSAQRMQMELALLGPQPKARLGSVISRFRSAQDKPNLSEWVQNTVAAFELIRSGVIPREIRCPVCVLVRMDDLMPLSGPVDMTGPARVLIGGHALSLPPGSWTSRIRVSISENLSGNTLYSDVFAEDVMVNSTNIRLPAEGRLEFRLDFDCRDPYFPILFRLAIIEGAIEGKICLDEILIYRRSM